MNSSYFDIPYWDNSSIFNKDDIIYLTGSNGAITYYYCLVNNNQGDNPIASSLWDSTFHWIPSYSTASEMAFGTISTQTNYPLRSAQGINNELIKTTLVFENRSEKEAKAITNFVVSKGANEAFPLTHYLFNGTGLQFIASDINTSYNYNNLYNISILIEQTPL